MEQSFQFFRLPVEVQCKILKQYVPFLCKSFVLSRLPEFNELLDCRSSWLSETSLHLSRILCPLQPGLYWNLEQDANAGYYVSIDSEKISFTLCSITNHTLNDYLDNAFYPYIFDKKPRCISLQSMLNFSTLFFNKYFVTNSIKIYQSNFGHYFFINFFTERIHWGKKMYAIQNKKCIIRQNLTETFIIQLKENDHIQLIHHHMKPELEQEPFVRTEQEIVPTSLEEHILNLQQNKIYNQRKLLEIQFQFIKDYVLLQMDSRPLAYTRFGSVYRRRGQRFPFNGVRRVKHTFEELNSLFVPFKRS